MTGSKLDTWDFVAVASYFAAVLGAGLYVSEEDFYVFHMHYMEGLYLLRLICKMKC